MLRLDLTLTIGALLTTVAVASIVAGQYARWIEARAGEGEWSSAAVGMVSAMVVFVLVYGGVVYEITRLGFLLRLRSLDPAREASELDYWARPGAPDVLALVPSYREDPRLVRQTLLSVALQDYPRRRVVLLIDDPPLPSRRDEQLALQAARRLPAELQEAFDEQAAPFQLEHEAFRARRAAGSVDGTAESERLARLYRRAGTWLQRQAVEFWGEDHTDRFFCDLTLLGPARRLRLAADGLAASRPSPDVLGAHYRRLAGMFDVEFSSFERKRFVNLSHEPNKAMNLNSYLGLIGGRYKSEVTPEGLLCVAAAEDEAAEREIRAADFVLTLDADSLLTPDYLRRLVQAMEDPGNQDVAVVQTPYSAVPGSSRQLERVAGATTDIQYLIHQGFTRFRSTFWVGANALLRKSALDDIAGSEEERGYPIRRYIQDRTVIEDTESTVDLIDRGWRLYNYPERLSFSATPPDFGSLLIQRRRWANGGLIILPKLLRYHGRHRRTLPGVIEAGLRVHYLASIAAVNVGLVLLLTLPLGDTMWSWYLPLTAVPYFLLYARDLRMIGYRATDLVRVYALNLLLIPVNLGGVMKSLQQALTKQKIPFGRTPKVDGRTAAPAGYLLSEYVLLALWTAGGAFSLSSGNVIIGSFALANAALLGYALVTFVGLSASWRDIFAGRVTRRAPLRLLGGRTATSIEDDAEAA